MRANGVYSSAGGVGKTMTAMNLTLDCCEHSVCAPVSRSIMHGAKTLRTAQSHPRPLSQPASCPPSHFGTAHNSESRLCERLKKRFAPSSRRPARGNATTKYHNNKEPDQSDPGSRKQTRSSTINSEGAPDTLAELGNRCRGLCGKLEPDSKSDHFDANRAFACLPGSRCSAGCQTLYEAIDASRQTRVHPHQHKPRGDKAKHRTDHCGPPGSSMSID